MKKIRLLGVALCASALMLAGCDKGGDNTSGGDTTATQPVVDPAITSISVSPKTSVLGFGETVQLSAAVVAVGGASTAVNWSVDSQLATVSSSGLVTAGTAVGSVTVTITSVFDATKTASATISIVDKGWNPAVYDEGYKFTKTWSEVESAFTAFVGTGEYSLEQPGNIANGVYYNKFTPGGNYVDYFGIVVEGDQLESYCEALEGKSYRYFYDSYYELDCFVNPTNKYEVDVSLTFDEEEYDYVEPTILTFYKASDLFSFSEKSTATEWTDEQKKVFEDAEMDLIPFIALDPEAELEASEGQIAYYDSNINDFTSGYGEKLIAAGYTYDSDNDVYRKQFGDGGIYEYVVQFGWGGGNAVVISSGYHLFDDLPTALIDSIYNVGCIESEYKLPLATVTAGLHGFAIDTLVSEQGFTGYIGVSGLTREALQAYVTELNKFVEDNHVLDSKFAYDASEEKDGYVCLSGYIGNIGFKIELEAELSSIYLDENEEIKVEYDWTNPEASFYIFNSGHHEIVGIYLPEVVGLQVGEKTTLQVEEFHLPELPAEEQRTYTFSLEFPAQSEYVNLNTSTGEIELLKDIPDEVIVQINVESNVDSLGNQYAAQTFIITVRQVTETIDKAFTGVDAEGKGAYADWEKTTAGGLGFAGQSAGSKGGIQLRSKNENSGIITTTPVGQFVSITVKWVEDTGNNNRKLNIYGANEAFESPEDLYGSVTPVAQLTASSGGTQTYVFEEAYSFIGLRSDSGAQYIASIEITYIPA